MCMVEFDSDRPRFYAAAERLARKPHRCGECRRTIAPGERYEYAAGKWDDISTFKTCLDCVRGPDVGLMEAIWAVRSQHGRRDAGLECLNAD